MSAPNVEFVKAVNATAAETGIAASAMLDSLASVLHDAYKRMPDAVQPSRVFVNPVTGAITVYGEATDANGTLVRQWDATPDRFDQIAVRGAGRVLRERTRSAG